MYLLQNQYLAAFTFFFLNISILFFIDSCELHVCSWTDEGVTHKDIPDTEIIKNAHELTEWTDRDWSSESDRKRIVCLILSWKNPDYALDLDKESTGKLTEEMSYLRDNDKGANFIFFFYGWRSECRLIHCTYQLSGQYSQDFLHSFIAAKEN